MIAPFRILISYALQVVIGTAAPVGICLHAYSPEAPAEKIECFEFERVERTGADYRFFPRAGKSVMVTAYRFRGTILYKPDLAPTHPDFDKQLKLYENTARATPSTRAFLNPKILAMRSQSAAVARQAESVAALPAITLPDGSKLVGCTVSKIEGGFVSVRHQNGISKISLKELDATEKKALNSTTDEWSLDEPSATPKDSTGTFAKIVLKNGRLLNKAKFKEVADGKLVFIADGNSVSVPVNEFPGELAILGEDVVKSLASMKKESSPEPSVATSSDDDPPAAPVRVKQPDVAPGGALKYPGKDVSEIVKIDQIENRIKKRTEELAANQNKGDSGNGKYDNKGTVVIKGLFIGMNGEDAMIQLRSIFGNELQFRKQDGLHNGYLEVVSFRVESAGMSARYPYQDCLIDIDSRTGRLSAFSVSGDHLDKMFSSVGLGFEDFAKQFINHFGFSKLVHQASEGGDFFNVYACEDENVKIRVSSKIGEPDFKFFSMDEIVKAKF